MIDQVAKTEASANETSRTNRTSHVASATPTPTVSRPTNGTRVPTATPTEKDPKVPYYQPYAYRQ